MIDKKFIYSLIAFIALSFTFVACSNDDNEDNGKNYSIPLTYKKTEVVEFKMYVGSETGGKEVSTENIDPKKFWDGYTPENDDFFFDREILFKDNSSLSLKIEDVNHTLPYKFEDNGALFVYNENAERPQDEKFLLGYGNTHKIIAYGHCSRFNKITGDGSAAGSGIDDDGEHTSLNDFIGNEEGDIFGSLAEMKHKEDTIMWYNFKVIYTK